MLRFLKPRKFSIKILCNSDEFITLCTRIQVYYAYLISFVAMHSVNNDKVAYVMVMTEMKSMTRTITNGRADDITLIRSVQKLSSPPIMACLWMEIWYCTSRNELEEANYLDANRAVAIVSWLRLGHQQRPGNKSSPILSVIKGDHRGKPAATGPNWTEQGLPLTGNVITRYCYVVLQMFRPIQSRRIMLSVGKILLAKDEFMFL